MRSSQECRYLAAMLGSAQTADAVLDNQGAAAGLQHDTGSHVYEICTYVPVTVHHPAQYAICQTMHTADK